MSVFEMWREVWEMGRRRGVWGLEYLRYEGEALAPARLTLRIAATGGGFRVGCPEVNIEVEAEDEASALMRFLEAFVEAKRLQALGAAMRGVSVLALPHYFARIVRES